ncbi:MAG TPA: hypothetical protein VE954_29140 [Oligoflexus sp.]|uniref:hypothetical protein n=1 Tax=Oligoflexus sp. TaxID=1971216 RepID=UPI002D3DC385|nr:hypothetical protein [Oligoflexus sp.]HYX37188.1 hypothetical protein [Oligoflexus sp.]
MKIAVLTSGLLLMSLPIFAAGAQQVELGSDQTYTIDGMKDRCRLFQGSAQLKPFSIRIECSKTENRWDAISQKRPLPMWVEYNAAGLGKGIIAAEKVKENLAPQEYECVNYQEKTILYKGYVELSCDEFIQQVSSLKTLCAEGFVSKDGAESLVDWQQVGEQETGSQFTNGCQSQIEEVGQAQQPGTQQKPGQQQPGQQAPGQQAPGDQAPGQQGEAEAS